MADPSHEYRQDFFLYGSTWLRADFHLHTNADKEFSYNEDESKYIDEYLERLKEAEIGVGVITNHNKFNVDEYKKLRKRAKKENIFLLPGLELSVKDGSNGVHTLIVFSEEWIINKENTDYINNFLNLTFAGQSNFENENARSNHDIMSTIDELDMYSKDYFLVFAHVESDNGLLGSLAGGRLAELGKLQKFKEKTLAFQKVRTYDLKQKSKEWFGNWFPAEVEGCDCKSIDEIGRGNPCYIKIGDFTYEAVKFAIMDFQNRVSSEVPSYRHSCIKSVSFEGGLLNGRKIHFSPELNSLIGIRGSGKSAILEAIRYVLDIPYGEKASDVEYKRKLIEYTFGSGGKAVISALDRHGRPYEITRILNEYPEVYVDGDHQPGLKVRETVLHKPIYFGQKDLSSTGEGFEKDLVEKLVGDKLVELRGKISEQASRVGNAIENLQKVTKSEEQKAEYEAKKQNAEFSLKVFKEHGVEEKLEKRINFEKDERKLTSVVDFCQAFKSELADFISRFEDDFQNLPKYKSVQNELFFNEFFTVFQKVYSAFQAIKQALINSQSAVIELQNKKKEFDALKKGLTEEFAEVERKLSEELKDKGAGSIRPDEFIHLRKALDQANQMLKLLAKQSSQKALALNDLVKELTALNELWHSEFLVVKSELDKINQTSSALTIESQFKGDKSEFKRFLVDMFKGSRIRESTFAPLVDEYSDFIAMYKDFDQVKTKAGSSPEVFEEYFFDNLKSLLTYQVPNQFRIKYRDKELKHHSLGQRASALILFVLSQKENDVIIIDQPEDDLDNQTIYEDVIKLICKMKSGIQFIFATHNANFPVLGDAEQIHSCRFSDEKIEFKSGSIDNPSLQKEIVDIMEGGEEAFNKRKEIYQIWNPQNS